MKRGSFLKRIFISCKLFTIIYAINVLTFTIENNRI